MPWGRSFKLTYSFKNLTAEKKQCGWDPCQISDLKGALKIMQHQDWNYRYLWTLYLLFFQMEHLCVSVDNDLWSLTGDTEPHYIEHDGVSNHQRLGCLLNFFVRHRSNNTSKLRITDLPEGNPPVTGGFPSQKVSNAGNVSIWWRHRASRHTAAIWCEVST